MDSPGSSPLPRTRRSRRSSCRPVVTTVKAMLAGVAGVYLATGSFAVTVVAAAGAVLVATLVRAAPRGDRHPGTGTRKKS